MADLPTAPTRPAFALPPGGGFGSGGPFGAGAPRPPGMASLNAGLGAGGGGGGGVAGGLRGLGGLKSRPKPMKFVEKKLDEDTIDLQWRTGALERMRALDTYRKPTPLSEECDLLRISDKRLDMHVLKEVLCLCGGNAGGRFSDQEFAECLSFSKTLPIIWNTASAVFETLDKNERKVVLSRSYKLSLEEQAARYSELVAPVPAAEAELTPPLAAEAKAEAEVGPAVEADEPEEVQHAALVRYHRLADAYTRCVRQCQDMARRKQAELQVGDSASGSGSGIGSGNNSSDSSSSSSSSSSSRSDGGGGGSTTAADKDDDESKGKPLPDWLQILHDKYELYGMPVVAHNLEFPPNGSSTPPVTHASALKLKSFTVGKLAGYLSGIMTSTLPADTANAEEEEAMWWLLQASTDCHLVVSSDMTYAAVKALAVQSADDSLDVPADAGVSDTADASASTGAPPMILNRTYWARRFYQFLSKMTEMKSRPKDEKGLLLFSLHVPPMDPEVNLAPTPADFERKAQREATARDPFHNSACV